MSPSPNQLPPRCTVSKKLPAFGLKANLRAAAVWLIILVSSAQMAEGGRRIIQFHVSDRGDDQWPGTLSKPFASLQRARDAVREVKRSSAGSLNQNVEIITHGDISIFQPLTLDQTDSGTKTCSITYKAAKESKWVGGISIHGFSPVTNPATLSAMDENARAQVVQVDLRALGITNYGSPSGGGIELFFNAQPMTPARWPNAGFTKIAGVLTNKPNVIHGRKGDLVGDILYDGDRPSRWVREQDPWVHGYWFWDWADQRQPIESIDPLSKLIKLKPPYHHYGYRQGQYYYAYNLLSELDAPGEWYVDRREGVLYFWPPSDPAVGRTIVSVVETAIRANGIAHVRFENLRVEAVRQDAIEIINGSQVVISDCVVRNTGGCAINLSGGDNCTVRDCEIFNLGRGGIHIGGGDRITLAPANHQVVRCHIHDYGRIVRMYSAGVAVSGVGNRVTRCLIHDAPHQAISFGGIRPHPGV